MFCEVDFAHPSHAEQRAYLIIPHAGSGTEGSGLPVDQIGSQRRRGGAEKSGVRSPRSQQAFHLIPKGAMAGAGGIEIGGPIVGREIARVQIDLLDFVPVTGGHRWTLFPAPTSRASHARAIFHSRLTVTVEMP